MISCDIIQDLLPLYADGQASDASRQLIEEHIKHCEVCSALASAMCTTIEPPQDIEEVSYIEALKKQKRKNRNRIILTIALTALLCIIGWWLYMEVHFTLETPVLVSTSEKDILKEMPQLALTLQEKAFAEDISEISVIREAMGTDPVHIIPLETVEAEVLSILPANGVLVEVSTTQNTVYLSYMLDDHGVTLGYMDPNHDGTVDAIEKMISNGNFSGKGADTVYSLRYIPVLDSSQYEKQVLRHVWFGFLKMP